MTATIEVPLSRGLIAIIDDEDADLICPHKWYASVQPHTTYARRTFRCGNGQQARLSMHGVITGWPRVDHRDGDGLNNTRANLRPATFAENNRNCRLRRDNSSGFRGVVWDRRDGCWYARIRVDGRRLGLGSFADPVEAARAYDAAASHYHGEYASLNFPGVEA